MSQFHAGIEEPFFKFAGVFHANGHVREQILQDARRREIIRGADVVHVDRYGRRRFGVINRKAGDQQLGIGKHILADPGWRQIGQHFFPVGQVFQRLNHLRPVNQRSMREHHAFGLARGARGIEHGRGIFRADPVYRINIGAGCACRVGISQLLQRFPGHKQRIAVMTQSTRVVINHMRQRMHLLAYLEHFVNLFLVFGHDNSYAGVLQHIDHLLSHRILIHGHRNGADCLLGHHGHIQARPVLTHNCNMLAGLHTEMQITIGDALHLRRHLCPGIGLPDTQVFFPERRPAAPDRCMMLQQRRKCLRNVGIRAIDLLRHVVSLP